MSFKLHPAGAKCHGLCHIPNSLKKSSGSASAFFFSWTFSGSYRVPTDVANVHMEQSQMVILSHSDQLRSAKKMQSSISWDKNKFTNVDHQHANQIHSTWYWRLPRPKMAQQQAHWIWDWWYPTTSSTNNPQIKPYRSFRKWGSRFQ